MKNNQTIWQNSSFRSLWFGSGISELGGALGTFCNSVYVYMLTGSELALGSMWLLYYVPSILIQFFIGPYLDHWRKKTIMISVLWCRAFLFIIPLVLLLLDSPSVWSIYIIQFFVGLLTPLYVPASQSLLPQVVSSNQLIEGNAYLDSLTRTMMLVAPLIAGFIMDILSIEKTLIVIIGLFAISGAILFSVTEKRQLQIQKQAWKDELKNGWNSFFQQKLLFILAGFLAIVQLGVGASIVLNLPYITVVHGSSMSMYGFFMAGFPLGYVIGSLCIKYINVNNKPRWMLLCLIIGGCTYIINGVTSHVWVAISSEILAGIAMSIFTIWHLTMFQQKIDDNQRTQLLSIRMLIIRIMLPIGILIGGFISELFTIRLAFIIMGLITCISATLGLLYFRLNPIRYWTLRNLHDKKG